MKKFDRRSEGLLYFALLTGVFLVLYARHFDFLHLPGSFTDAVARLFFFDRYVAEFLLIGAVLALLLERGPVARILSYAGIFGYLFINLVQWSSLRRGYEFLSRVALENTGHISLVLDVRTVALVGSAVLAFLLFVLRIESRAKVRKPTTRPVAVLMVCLAAGSLYMSRWWLPVSIMNQREIYLIRNHLLHTSPIVAFVKILMPARDNLDSDLTPNERLEARKFGFEINLDNHYPFITETFYSEPLPFERKAQNAAKPNIIVFFAEGFSARTVGAYGSQIQGLTPHIDQFAAQSMRVDNYFNHTAATYRGLHGQLCSIFPTYGGIDGWDKNLKEMPTVDHHCLNRILNGNSYKTLFFDTHRKDSAQIDEMMAMLGFDKVWTAEELSQQFLKGVEPLRGDAFSDPQFFDSFIGWLKGNETTLAQGTPFFAGLYNLGTHAWQDVQADGTRFGDGSNNVLNTIHTFDQAFGKFWQYFQASPYAENTIVVLTADHSHYPEEPYVRLFADDPKFRPIFVDRIPLIIYDPLHQLPASLDVNYSTSIDFAPTMAHLLEIPNQKNPFLGFSMFEPRHKIYEGVGLASIGGDVFVIDKDGIHNREFPNRRTETIRVVERIIQKTKEIELSNRLWHLESRL